MEAPFSASYQMQSVHGDTLEILTVLWLRFQHKMNDMNLIIILSEWNVMADIVFKHADTLSFRKKIFSKDSVRYSHGKVNEKQTIFHVFV